MASVVVRDRATGLVGILTPAFFVVSFLVQAATLTVITGALLIVGIVVLKFSELPEGPLFDVKGLVQRLVLVLFMMWSAAFAVLRTAR